MKNSVKKIPHQQSHCGYQTNSPHGCTDPSCKNYLKISTVAQHGNALGASHTYDKQSDALYITIKRIERGDVGRTVEVRDGILLDFDKYNNVIGIEVLHPSKIDLGL